MIVIRYKESHQISDLFDTAKEFKSYIKEYLEEMDKGMKADGLQTNEMPRTLMSFECMLDEYLTINDELEVVIQ